jgi:hypothetical protein
MLKYVRITAFILRAAVAEAQTCAPGDPATVLATHGKSDFEEAGLSLQQLAARRRRVLLLFPILS